MKTLLATAVMFAITGVVSQSVAQTNVPLSGGMGSTSPLGADFGCPAASSQSTAIPYSGTVNPAPFLPLSVLSASSRWQLIKRVLFNVFQRFPKALGTFLQALALYRDQVAKHMTSEQIAEAQRLAREWKPEQ